MYPPEEDRADHSITAKDPFTGEVLVENLGTRFIAICLKPAQAAGLLSDMVNCGAFYTKEGLQIGNLLSKQHSAIQANVIRLLVNILKGLASQSGRLDDRNRYEVMAARRMVQVAEEWIV